MKNAEITRLLAEVHGGNVGAESRLASVERDWKVAKAWLHGELSSVKTDDSGPMAVRQSDHR
jgi:hypothetical protein